VFIVSAGFIFGLLGRTSDREKLHPSKRVRQGLLDRRRRSRTEDRRYWRRTWPQDLAQLRYLPPKKVKRVGLEENYDRRAGRNYGQTRNTANTSTTISRGKMPTAIPTEPADLAIRTPTRTSMTTGMASMRIMTTNAIAIAMARGNAKNQFHAKNSRPTRSGSRPIIRRRAAQALSTLRCSSAIMGTRKSRASVPMIAVTTTARNTPSKIEPSTAKIVPRDASRWKNTGLYACQSGIPMIAPNTAPNRKSIEEPRKQKICAPDLGTTPASSDLRVAGDTVSNKMKRKRLKS